MGTERILFAALVVTLALSDAAFAKPRHSLAEFAGTWRNNRNGETMTIKIDGDSAIITYSSGSPDSGKIDRNVLEYQGVAQTDTGEIKTTGTMELSDDGKSVINRRALYYSSEIRTENESYTRISGGNGGS